MMRLHYSKKRQTVLFLVFVLLFTSTFCQQNVKPNEYYKSVANRQSLGEVLPIDDIQSIAVINYSGTHTLASNELAILKKQLKQAKFAGGLLVKPGHITLSIRLKTETKAKTGFVYAYNGMVNFDGGVDKAGNNFSGTYYLPLSINFDNYK